MNFWKKLRGTFNSEIAVDPPSPEELFMAEVELVLRELPGVTSIGRRPHQFALEVSVLDETHTLALKDIFQETRELTPTERRERIQLWLGGVVPILPQVE